MLTPFTQTALAVLNDIACGEISTRSTQYALFPHALSELLVKLESYGIIQLIPGQPRNEVLSYKLCHKPQQITLLDILQAIGEHLNCNQETCEEMYLHYGVAARKLGVVNRITRQYLEEIKLTDL